MDVKARLKKARKAMKAARKRVADDSGGFAEFDDGRYVARLVGAEIGESASSGRLQITFQWAFLEGEYRGQRKYEYRGIMTEDDFFWLGRMLARLGYDLPDDADSLPEFLEGVVEAGIIARIRLRSKGDFQNVLIDRVLSDWEEDDAEETEDDDEEVEDSEDSEDSDDSDDDEDEDDDDEDDDEEVPEEPKKRRRRRRG